MSEDVNDTITTSSLNNLTDQREHVKTVQDEEYNKKDGNRIADQHKPLDDTEATPSRSWALSEIERTVATEILPVGRQKISQFGVALSKRNDFKMRDLATRLDRANRMEFPDDINPKAASRSNALRQIRDFDIRTHTYRQITANAVLGSYQFQRMSVLPYMRKSLALDYQKTSLLKRLHEAIGGLEKSIVVKLEAIKMNTAATAPSSTSLFARVKNAIRDKHVDRIATNISNKIMEGRAKTWEKRVAPVIDKLHAFGQDSSPTGGANKASRKVTSKLNRIRKQLSNFSESSIGEDDPLGGIRRKGAGFVSGILGGAVKTGQKFKLSAGWNRLATRPLTMATEFMHGFNPFSNGAAGKQEFKNLEKVIEAEGLPNANQTPQLESLTKLLTGWKESSVRMNKRLLEHVSAIRQEVSTIKLLRNAVNPESVTRLPSTINPANTPSIAPGPVSKPTTPPIKPVKASRKPWFFNTSKPISVAPANDTVSTPSTSGPVVRSGGLVVPSTNKVSMRGNIFGIGKSAGKFAISKFLSFGKAVGRRHREETHQDNDPETDITPKPETNSVSGKAKLLSTPVKIGKALLSGVSSVGAIVRPTTRPGDVSALTKLSAATAWSPPTKPVIPPAANANNPDPTGLQSGQNQQTSLLSQLTSQMTTLDQTIKNGNDARALYEQNQMQRQKIADETAAKLKVRKGSYEDLQAQRLSRQLSPVDASDQTKATAAAVVASANGFSGSDKEDAGEEEGGSLFDTLTDLFGNKDDDKEEDKEESSDSEEEPDKKKKKKGKKPARRRGSARPGARERYHRMRSKKGIRGLFNRGTQGLRSGGAKGLAKFAAGELWEGTKSATKLAGRGALGATKIGGKGLMGAIASGGKGVINVANSGMVSGLVKGGLAAGAFSVAGDMLQKSDAPDIVKKAGNTVSTMASYGSMGATIGSIVPGVGTAVGAAIGASLGALIANADSVSAGFSALASGTKHAVTGLWTSIFGQNAKIDSSGKVVQQEKSSLLGDVKSFFVGRDAKYTSDGQMLVSGRDSLLGNIKYGLEKTFFGDRFSNGEFKEGTSLLDEARDGLKGAIISFKDQLINLPRDMKETFKKGLLYKSGVALKEGASWGAGKIADGAQGTKKAFVDMYNSTKPDPTLLPMTTRIAMGAANAWNNFSLQKTKDAITNVDPSTLAKWSSYLTPTGFITGVSNAILGWWNDSAEYDDPATPQYKYVELVLGAYGIKNRAVYKFVHSLETSQEKVNKNQAKPFDDKDMSYMASRFGFDPKNQDAVNYFKLWYKKRFLPAMLVVDKALKSRNLTFSSVLGADAKEIEALNDVLKKEIAGGGIMQLGLEPTVAAYNKYAKIGTQDPGGLTQSAMNKDKPFDPRDPSNTFNSGTGGTYNPSSQNNPNQSGNDSYNYGASPEATRKQAAMVKGGIKDQPEYKAAYQKLPPNIRKIVDGSRPLQFVLWSTSVQHGPNGAELIFERDYSESLDDAGYLRTIYQDRARQFNALNENDRAAAINHLGDEQRFASGLNNSSYIGRNQASSYVNNVYDPSGGYNTNGGTFKRRKGMVPITPSARQHLEAAAQQLGVSPIELAGLASYESVGSFNPAITGGKNGNYQGIFQFGPGERSKYGVNNRSSIEEQLDAFVRFAQDRGYRPGMGWQKLYTTINAGNPNASVRASDGNGTQLDHYRNIQRQHFANAAMWLQGGGKATQDAPASGGAKPTQQAAKPQPAAKPQQTQRPAPAVKPKPQPATKPATTPAEHAAWVAGIGDLAKATRENTAAINANRGPMKAAPTAHVLSPLIVKGQDNGGGNSFLTMSVKKSMLVTGK